MKKLFVFLHGFGFDKTNNSTSIQQFQSAFPNRSFVGYNALFSSGRSRGGYARYLHKDETTQQKDYTTFEKNTRYLTAEIEKKLTQKNLQRKDVILCGRSQGAYTALHLGLSKQCHSIISLCGFTDEYTTNQIPQRSTYPKIYWFEAKNDTVLDKSRLESYHLLDNKHIEYSYILDETSDHDNLSIIGIEKIIKEVKK